MYFDEPVGRARCHAAGSSHCAGACRSTASRCSCSASSGPVDRWCSALRRRSGSAMRSPTAAVGACNAMDASPLNFAPDAGWSSLAARRAHNPKVAGSNPAPATSSCWRKRLLGAFFVWQPDCSCAGYGVARQRGGLCRVHLDAQKSADIRTMGPLGPFLFLRSGRGSIYAGRRLTRHDGQGRRNRSAAGADRAIARAGTAGRRIPAVAGRRDAAPISTCRYRRCRRRRRPVGIEDCEAVEPRSCRRCSTSTIRSPGITRSKCRRRASIGRCSRRRISRASSAQAVKITLKLPQDGRRRLQGTIVRVEGEQHRVRVGRQRTFAVAHAQHRKGAAGARLGSTRACAAAASRRRRPKKPAMREAA